MITVCLPVSGTIIIIITSHRHPFCVFFFSMKAAELKCQNLIVTKVCKVEHLNFVSSPAERVTTPTGLNAHTTHFVVKLVLICLSQNGDDA